MSHLISNGIKMQECTRTKLSVSQVKGPSFIFFFFKPDINPYFAKRYRYDALSPPELDAYILIKWLIVHTTSYHAKLSRKKYINMVPNALEYMENGWGNKRNIGLGFSREIDIQRVYIQRERWVYMHRAWTGSSPQLSGGLSAVNTLISQLMTIRTVGQ